MKNSVCAQILLALMFTFSGFSQSPQPLPKENFLKSNYISPSGSAYGDSLKGFKESAIAAWLISKNVIGTEYINYLHKVKREYINEKYSIGLPQPYQATASNYLSVVAGGKTISGNNSINVFPCVNEGFESTLPGAYTTATAVTGWTITSATATCGTPSWTAGSPEFSVVNTPILGFPGINIIANSPLGGSRVALINNYTPNTTQTKLSTTFPVSSTSSAFSYAFALYMDAAGHGCCDGGGLIVKVFNCNGLPVSCYSLGIQDGCITPGANLTLIPALNGGYINWNVRSINLAPFIGSCVTIEVSVSDCSFGGHFSTAVFDAFCGTPIIGNGFTAISGLPPGPIANCPGSNTAVLTAPQGYLSYSWLSPPGTPSIAPSQASLSTLPVPISSTTPMPIYTVNLLSNSCVYTATYLVVPTNTTQVGVVFLGSTPSCAAGSVGTATVQAAGSSVGYNYSWQSPFTTSVVSTASTAAGLAPGIYTVLVSAPNNSACGTANTTVTVNTGTLAPTVSNKYFCGTTAYFSSPVGSNFQWYLGNSPVSGAAGTSSTYTLFSASVGNTVRLGRNYQGCRDSTIYLLAPTNPGTLSILSSSTGCQGSNNGNAIITITPGAQFANTAFSYSVLSLSSGGQVYAASPPSINSTTFQASGLPVGQTLFANVFDGNCYVQASMSISPVVPAFSYSVSPATVSVCSGSSISASIVFTGSTTPGQYSFSWTPVQPLASGNSTLQNVTIIPIANTGTISNLIFTVVVTPTAANCPVTRTLSVVASAPQTPTISPINPLCNLGPQVSVLANPLGGVFSGPGVHPVSGIITPSLAIQGINGVTYFISLGNCTVGSTASYTVSTTPTLTISGNYTVCSSAPCQLTASGASTYTWTNGPNSAQYAFNPVVSGVYTVSGSDVSGSCQSTKTVMVNAIPLPTPTLTGNFTLCTGESSFISVFGAYTYSWNFGPTSAFVTLTPTSTTQYTLSTTDANTSCTKDSVLTLVVNTCLNFREMKQAGNFKIFPNPSTGKFYVDAPEESQMTVYSTLGQLVLPAESIQGVYLLDLSAMSDGVYMVKLVSETGYIHYRSLVKRNTD